MDPTRTSLSGTSGRIGINKIGGQRLRFMSQVGFKSPGFDLNDAGFLRRADERWLLNWVQIRSDVPNRWFRSRNLNFNEYMVWNADGDRLVNGVQRQRLGDVRQQLAGRRRRSTPTSSPPTIA